MNVKKNILVFADWYLPAYKAGGPVKSLAALCYHLKDDFNFYILTGNTDLFSTVPHPTVKSNEWNTLTWGEKVYYLSAENKNIACIKKIISGISYDYVYLNSFFSKTSTIYPLLLKKRGFIKAPVILAPRGMLSKGALSLKPGKKKAFIAFAKIIGLYKNICWHTTSKQECQEIENVFGNNTPIRIAPNMVLPPLEKRVRYDKEAGGLRMCCIARVSAVKNILFAIEVLQEIKNGSVVFDIYGPLEEPDYYKRCLEACKRLPDNIQVSFKGDIPSAGVEKTLQNYHLFFLPTLNENFGHAIAEAMLNGCIPVISDTTPWRNLEEKNIGWDISLTNKNKYRTALQSCLQLSNTEFETKSKNIQQYAHGHCFDKETINQYKQLFA